MSDIVERLRHCSVNYGAKQLDVLTTSAANTIEDLRAEVDRLRGNLRAELGDHIHGTPCAQIRWQQEREELQTENDRLRAALRAAFDAGSELGWDHATYSERGGPEPIGHEDAFAAFLAALDGQPAQPQEEA